MTPNLRKCLLLCLCFFTLLSAQVSSKPLPTTISTDGDPLKPEFIVICSPITTGKGGITKILGKVLNLPKTIKIESIGYLATSLSNEAFQVKAADKNSFQVTTALPYLKKSKELEDSLKLRRTARNIKFQVVSQTLKSLKELTEEQKQDIIQFLSKQIGAPLYCLDKTPLPVFLPQPGPCMIPIGAQLIDQTSGKEIGLDTSVICLLDIVEGGKTYFSLKDAILNDTLDLVLCHENGHAIMFDMYGKAFKDIQRVSTNGHDAPYITDVGLGYIEGWAEAFEAFYGPANPKLKEKDRKKYNISEFLFSRQDPIRRDRYIWAKYIGKKTGVLKNGLQLVSTEGVVAGQFYDILSSKAINAPFEKCVSTMLQSQPKSYPEFVKAFAGLYPADKKVLYRIVLEGLNYSTMSNEARKLYHTYYQTKLDYVQKKIAKDVHLKSKNAFLSFKEDLFKQAMSGKDIFANVGPQLWFSGILKLEKKHGLLDLKYKLLKKIGQDPDLVPFNLDLNTATAKMLSFFGGLEAEDAQKIVDEREKTGFFTGNPLNVLRKILGEAKFKAVQAKNKLKLYDPKAGSDPKTQAGTLWPEDIEKLRSSD